MSFIDEQPTACDVERLGELNENKFTFGNVMGIIKAGGING